MFEGMVTTVRDVSPLVHCITNYVTVNDVANIILAVGASPVMADAIEEAAVFGGICRCLNLNLGTLNSRTVDSMLAAGEAAAGRGVPIVLDPVGVGATPFRIEVAQRILERLPIAVLRGNTSEIKALARAGGTVKGVDASAADAVTEEALGEAVAFAKDLAASLGLIVSFSGPIDVIADAETAYIVRNGVDMMPRVTGSGCMLTGVVSSFVGSHPDRVLEATAAAYAAMGLCGDIAHARLAEGEGTGTFRARLIDAMSNLTDEILQRGMKVERR